MSLSLSCPLFVRTDLSYDLDSENIFASSMASWGVKYGILGGFKIRFCHS